MDTDTYSAAMERWPQARIMGNGRFALHADVLPVLRVWLLDSYTDAVAASERMANPVLIDLDPCPVIENPREVGYE